MYFPLPSGERIKVRGLLFISKFKVQNSKSQFKNQNYNSLLLRSCNCDLYFPFCTLHFTFCNLQFAFFLPFHFPLTLYPSYGFRFAQSPRWGEGNSSFIINHSSLNFIYLAKDKRVRFFLLQYLDSLNPSLVSNFS
jgi:hypothetical protein